jgi:hypothetical protein
MREKEEGGEEKMGEEVGEKKKRGRRRNVMGKGEKEKEGEGKVEEKKRKRGRPAGKKKSGKVETPKSKRKLSLVLVTFHEPKFKNYKDFKYLDNLKHRAYLHREFYYVLNST